MTKILNEYKGVILFFIVLIIMASMLNNRVKELNALNESNTIAYYEK